MILSTATAKFALGAFHVDASNIELYLQVDRIKKSFKIFSTKSLQ